MEIKKVFIDGYKNLNNVEIELDKITSLVSINNFGKSNFLNGIIFCVNFIKSRIRSREALLQQKNLMPINASCYGKNLTFKIEVEINDTNSRSFLVQYMFELKWGYKFGEEQIVSESLKLKENTVHQKYETIINRTEDKCHYKSSISSRCNTSLPIKKLELALNKLQAYDNIYFIDVIYQLNDISLYIEDSLASMNKHVYDPILIKNIGNAEITFNDLPEVLYRLKTKYENKYKLIQNAFSALFPNIIKFDALRIDVPHTNSIFDLFLDDDENGIYVLNVQDKNLKSEIKFEKMSDGAKRILILLTRLILAEISNIPLIIIEEPENSIHPGLLNTYIQIIAQLLNTSKIIFTSHSPYIISYLPQRSIYAGIPDGKGGAMFKKLKNNNIYKAALEENINVGEYLFTLLAENDEILSYYFDI